MYEYETITHWAGDIVELAQPQIKDPSMNNKVFRVVKVNPKNTVVETEDGRRLTGAHSLWRKTDKPFTSRANDTEEFNPGEIVRVPSGSTSKKWRYSREACFVVLKQTADSVHVAVIGGEPGGFYWRLSPAKLVRVPASHLKVIPD